MTLPTARTGFLIGAIACFGLLGSGYFIEYGLHVEPCSLCILQRWVFWVIGILFLTGALHNPKTKGVYLYSIFTLLMGIMGILLAARQIWLQHLPIEKIPSCTAGLNRLLEIYPTFEALKILFQSSGECASIDFKLLGFPLSEWSLVSFLFLTGFSFTLIFLKKKRRI